MELEAVDLNDEALLAPEEVDLMSMDAHVHLRGGELRRPYECEEALLGFGAGERSRLVAFEQLFQSPQASATSMAIEVSDQTAGIDKPSRHGFVGRELELARPRNGREVDEGSPRRRHRKPAEV